MCDGDSVDCLRFTNNLAKINNLTTYKSGLLFRLGKELEVGKATLITNTIYRVWHMMI